jgi:pimeloyl-ACP methyl ester carboxylesterase
MGITPPRTTSSPPSERRPAHGNKVARGVVLLGAFAVDYAIAGWVQVRALVSRNAPARYRRGDPAKPTIVLVPGVYETWLFMKPVADLLNERGYPVAVVRGLGYNRRPIVDTSTRLARALSRRPAPPAGRIVVAHSKGGLIGKHLMLTEGQRLDVRGMVAVCTPFAGSRLARWLLDPSLRAFLPTDSTIVSLSKHADVNSRIVSIYPPVDQHVPDGSQLAGATNVEIDVPGHFRLLSNPLGLAAILDGVESLVAEVASGPETREDAAAGSTRTAPDAAEVALDEEASPTATGGEHDR